MLKRILLFVFVIYNTNFSLFGISDDHACSVLEFFTQSKVELGKLTEVNTILLEIRDKSGDNYAEISIPYSKGDKLTLEYARIEDQQGNIIRELKKGDISEKSNISDISLFEDNYIKSFELKHNVYPYRVRYQWKYTYSRFQEIIRWIPFIDNKVPTEHARLEVQTPVGFPVKIFRNGIDNFKSDTTASGVTYSFEATRLKFPDKEINAFPEIKYASQVWMIPEKFTWIVSGSHKSWDEFGNWIYRLNEGADDISEVDAQAVRALIKGISSKREIIHILYKYLQEQTRYINVSIGPGGLKPFPASYVIKNKYGDCKALSIYMKAMLKVLNITSYYIVVYAGDNDPGLIHEMPGLQFNHAILGVPVEKDTMFIDCTLKGVPAGYLGTFTQGREALLVDNDSSRIIKLPELKPDEVKEFSHHRYNLTAENNCTVNLSSRIRGYKFDYLSTAEEYLNHNDLESLFRDRYFNFSSFELKNRKLEKLPKDQTVVELNADLNLHNFLKAYGNEFGFSVYPLSIAQYEKPAERKLPLYFQYPVYKIDLLEYTINPPLKTGKLPEPIRINSRFGEYSLVPEIEGNVISFKREFIIYKGEYSLTDYPDFFSFIQKIRKANSLIILLTKQ